MDLVRINSFSANKILIRNQKGQSTVEYILLLAVVMSLAFTVYNSKPFKDFLGEDSALFSLLAKRMEYAYRHGREGDEDNGDANAVHPTFQNEEEDSSRFFTGVAKYP